MRAGFLDIVFPRRCAGCAAGDWPFCADCATALSPLLPPWCARCGLPWPAPRTSCPGCPPAEIDGARAAFLYEGPARRAIHKLKFSGWRGVGDALGRAMAATGPPAADGVTWVPLARRRLAERGYDQAKVLAVAVARELGLPTARPIRRVVATGPQARRSAAERRTAMRGAFRPNGHPCPARVLLVDDVLTTGATAAACAAALREAGARSVFLLVAGRAAPGTRRPGSGSTAGAYTRPGTRPGLWLPGDHPR
jgi:predicted amidophosphoribosyltransferase